MHEISSLYGTLIALLYVMKIRTSPFHVNALHGSHLERYNISTLSIVLIFLTFILLISFHFLGFLWIVLLSTQQPWVHWSSHLLRAISIWQFSSELKCVIVRRLKLCTRCLTFHYVLWLGPIYSSTTRGIFKWLLGCM